MNAPSSESSYQLTKACLWMLLWMLLPASAYWFTRSINSGLRMLLWMPPMNAANAALNPVDPPNEREVPRSTEPSEKAHITHTGREDKCPPKFPTDKRDVQVGTRWRTVPRHWPSRKVPQVTNRWEMAKSMHDEANMHDAIYYDLCHEVYTRKVKPIPDPSHFGPFSYPP